MRILAGSLAATSGAARICGHDVRAASKQAKACLGYLPEGSPLYGDMTPEGLLDFCARVRGLDAGQRAERVAEVIRRLELEDVLHRSIDTLSKGYKRRLGLAQALVHDPKVLILDEPTDGLDPNQKQSVRKLINEIAAEKAIIISTHLLEEVDSICKRAIIIASGRIVGGGTPDELRRNAANHNTVKVRVPAADAARARDLMRNLPAVKAIDEQVESGVTALSATPKDGAFIADAVAGVLRAASVDIRSLDVETGRLDDVFHRLTREGGR
jgi:ABC-2 type transport system ATP-binding protein